MKTSFRYLNYVQRRTRPPIVQRYLHVYFKKVTGRSFAFLFDKKIQASHIQRRTNHPAKFIDLLFMLKQEEVWPWLWFWKKIIKKSKEDAALLSHWNIEFQVTTTLRILSYVQRRTRPPSVQRYLHILNSCHKEVVHVCLIKKIPESEPCSEEDKSSFKCLYLIKQKLIMSWLKIRKQSACDPPIILKYKIPVTTNFRILSYVQRRTRPLSVQRYFHVYFKKVTERSFACLFDKESQWAIFRGGRTLLQNS